MTQAEMTGQPHADPGGRRTALLARIGDTLGRSLDPTVTVQGIADALVPAFCDWCVVDLIGPNRELELVASAHRDPELAPVVKELRERYPPGERREPRHAIYRAIDGDGAVVERVSDEDLKRRAVDADHLELLRRLGIGSHVVLALESRGRAIGAISLIRRPDREPFDDDETAMAREIADRAALATDNAQLYRAAQDAVELRDRFIGVASHELRNPLAVVHGHWELLQRRLARVRDAIPADEAEKIEASLDRLGHGIGQLRRMVEELLDVRRITKAGMELRRSEMDLADATRQAVLEATDAQERVRLQLPAEPVTGSWDSGRLEQVVVNLVTNALKYSDDDAPVTVALEMDGSLARLRVTDAGIGIAPDEVDTIFEPFTRGRNAEQHHNRGLGLGLAVSREIVEMHGGRMWAESEGEERGSSFVVELDRRMS